MYRPVSEMLLAKVYITIIDITNLIYGDKRHGLTRLGYMLIKQRRFLNVSMPTLYLVS